MHLIGNGYKWAEGLG